MKAKTSNGDDVIRIGVSGDDSGVWGSCFCLFGA